MFRKLRILVLLVILATVSLEAWRTDARLTAWEHTVHVAIYPLAADASPHTAQFLAGLDREYFDGVAEWFGAQSADYGRDVMRPVAIRVAPVVQGEPPLPPRRPDMFEAVVWSLKMRWWASQHDDIDGPEPDVRLFVLFHDSDEGTVLPHSVGLSKGRLGLIHAFAARTQRGQNAVVVAHELLHTFGATDKYDLATLQPIHPDGYAEPALDPLLPQRAAEIMGGRIPVDRQRAEIPAGLALTVIGPQTAREIGLVRASP